MPSSRSPSPRRGGGSGGWSTPGLGSGNRSSNTYTNGSTSSPTSPERSRSFSKFHPKSQTQFGRIWQNLVGSRDSRRSSRDNWSLRGRWNASVPEWRRGDRVLPFVGRALWKLRLLFVIVIISILAILLGSRFLLHIYRHIGFLGGGNKYVILLATNIGGGVMEWKGPKDWAIERDSVKNKKEYAKRWGYELELIDMSTKKRYAHEWRESWEKIDSIRDAMHKYPKAEWFWWLDLHTFIMEPSYSLQKHIFNNLKENTYRDINVYNPLNISHPPTDFYLDPDSLSPDGDGDPNSINMIIPQDCAGFNLGSFMVRRGAWTERLLDIWWDPVGYEQKHMDWEHKEQDALEWIYQYQPWVRSHVAFVPQRRLNSFPLGACGDNGHDPKIHYNPKDRDFLVNMAGCQWGRDCWNEMFEFRKLSLRLNRSLFGKFWDFIRGLFRRKQ